MIRSHDRGVDLPRVDLTRVDLTGVQDPTRVDLTRVDLTKVDLTGVRVDLTKVDLTKVDLTKKGSISPYLCNVCFRTRHQLRQSVFEFEQCAHVGFDMTDDVGVRSDSHSLIHQR